MTNAASPGYSGSPNREPSFADGVRGRESRSRDTRDEGYDPALAYRVRLRGSHWLRQDPHTQIGKALVDFLSKDAIAVVDDEAVRMVARQRFPELLQRPFRRRICRKLQNRVLLFIPKQLFTGIRGR